MKHNVLKRRLLTVFAVLFAASSCVDSAYDLGNINLKITLGPNGVTLPLGKLDSLTVDSLVRRSEIKDLITEDGFYAYRLDSMLDERIDAVKIDPIRDVVPAIPPYTFQFTEGSLPSSIRVKGFQSKTSVSLPSFDLTEQELKRVSVSKRLDLGAYADAPGSDGMEFILPELSDTEDFSLQLTDIPDEIARIEQLYFMGNTSGTPIYVELSLGTLAQAVKSGKLSFTITLPSEYTLRLENTYGGSASVSGSVLTLRNYTLPSSGASFVFYIAERRVSETIGVQRTLNLQDDIRYNLTYTGISNGQVIPANAEPLFRFSITPKIGDATLVTNNYTPEPSDSSAPVSFEVDNLKGISSVKYIAFTENSANTLTLRASHETIPLNGHIPVQITFPDIYEFAQGTQGLSGNVLNTTLDRLTTGGLQLPLKGIRLSGSDAEVANGKLTISKTLRTLVSPVFPSETYRMSALGDGGNVDIAVSAADMTLSIAADESIVTAGFSEPVDIDQKIDQTFSVPDEVGAIYVAKVIDADNGGKASLDITLDIEDSPVDHCYFDNIDIALPAFLMAAHPNLDPKTNVVHINRAEYKGKAVTIAKITLNAIKDIPVVQTSAGKKARLTGKVQITATVNLPEDTQIDGLDQTEIVLLPNARISPLKVTHVTGKMDLDLQKYLKPTTIDLDDIRESLGDQDIEINLVAPQILLTVNNPVGVTMIGDIELQPYDFKNQKLDPVVVKGVTIEPAQNDETRTTKLFVTDLPEAPAGYTLCRVEELSKLVKTIPSKIDVTFNLKIDDTREQSFAITGEDYPFTVNYTIKLPLKFKDDARISYSDTSDVKKTFEDITDYEITAEDILVMMNVRSTIPLDLGVTVELLDAEGKAVDDVKALVLDPLKGYNPVTDGEYKESKLNIQLEIKDGDIQRLKTITTIRYTIEGSAVGTGAGLAPQQYITANMKLRLKKGISLDLNDL